MSTTEIIQTRISRRLGVEIDAAAKREGKTRSAIMREAAEQYLSDSRLAAQIAKGQTDLAVRLASLGTMLETMGLQVSDIHELTRGGQ
ncbi:ribbon-helix-helix protein, CopG family [Duganella sp. PWIR1]